LEVYMKKLSLRLITGISLISLALIISIIMYNQAGAQVTSFTYQWLEISPICNELSTTLGVQVNRVTTGDIIVGYANNGLPLTRKGIEVEFATQPTPEQLEDLDLKMLDLKRKGGKSIDDTVKELKEKIAIAEDAIIKLEKDIKDLKEVKP